jgi:nitrous oxide reductase accessory protein NosL
MMRLMSVVSLVFVVILGTAVVVASGPQPPPKPGPEERCAVCGMYVARYPSWQAVIELVDGSRLYFDGPKDMFKFLDNLEKHSRRPQEISRAWVTEYYSTRLMPAREAFFVSGSDVSGPMGAELVPVAGAEAAHSFAADHGGTAVLSFDEIGRERIPR